MTQKFGNVAFRYSNDRGKPVFAPSEHGRKVGCELKALVEARFKPDNFYYHLRTGGHVAAIHAHRSKRYFARLDLENFFYGVGRNRVARILQELGLNRGEYYAKWSTVRNPFSPPSYSLPYGFIQSPILASAVMSKSALGDYLREVSGQVVVSVYVDDICVSGNNHRVLERVYRKIRRKAVESNFAINEKKSAAAARTLELFNCHLEHLTTIVTDERQAAFRAETRSPRSQAAFEAYCDAIARGNS